MNDPITILKDELAHELINIMEYWQNNTQDVNYGGFYGQLDHYGKIIDKAPKGIILNTRILWSFSAASNHLGTLKYVDTCKRAFDYICDKFYDQKNKGVYWEVDFEGNPINRRKQIYAQAFAIYALSEYHFLTKDKKAKELAIEIFHLIEQHAFDPSKGGYLEAFDEKWGYLEDVRLSDKDMNAVKTMNTHLHLIEAYTTLLKIHRNAELESQLKTLIVLYLEKFLNRDNHFNLFFDEHWQLLSHTISYGHDIESAWLITEGAKALGDANLIAVCEQMAINVTDTFLREAIDDEDGVINEKNLTSNELDTDRHWWPQAEAMIGLIYVNAMAPNRAYLNAAFNIWEFTKKHLIDPINGEWHFRVDKNGQAYSQEDKVSMWKAPYHTSRACIMINKML